MNFHRSVLLVVSLLSLGFLGQTACAQTNSLREGHFREESAPLGPKTYKDPKSGTIFYVESDGRHLSAINKDGRLLWTKNPFVDAKLEPYRYKNPTIIYVGASKNKPELSKHDRYISISYNSTDFGDVNVKTGQFHYGGRD